MSSTSSGSDSAVVFTKEDGNHEDRIVVPDETKERRIISGCSNRIFVGNLINEENETNMVSFFQNTYGRVSHVHFVPHKFAFVTFENKMNAQDALETCVTYQVKPCRPHQETQQHSSRHTKKRRAKTQPFEFLHQASSEPSSSSLVIVLQCNLSHVTRMQGYIADKTQFQLLESLRIEKQQFLFLQHQGSSSPNDDVHACFLSNPHLLQRALNQVHFVQRGRCLSTKEAISKRALELVSTLSSQDRLRLQSFPSSLVDLLLETLNDDDGAVILSPTSYTHVLSLIQLSTNDNSNGTYYIMGLVGSSNSCLDCHSTKTKLTEHVPRAYYKLQEAFQRYFGKNTDIDLVLKYKVALDCGAAPGGWTLYLHQQGCSTIYSVDPGKLNPDILKLDGVVHLPIQWQHAIDKLPPKSVNVLCSDMCLHDVQGQVNLLRMAKPLLKPNAFFVLTLKCVKGHSDASVNEQVASLLAQLPDNCYAVQTVHLFVNRSRERTVMGYLS